MHPKDICIGERYNCFCTEVAETVTAVIIKKDPFDSIYPDGGARYNVRCCLETCRHGRPSACIMSADEIRSKVTKNNILGSFPKKRKGIK